MRLQLDFIHIVPAGKNKTSSHSNCFN